MSLPQMVPRSKSNVIPFVALPALARRVRGLMMSYTAGKITRAALNDHLAELLPLHQWVDCGLFSVRVDGYVADSLPVVTFQGKYSLSGMCPVCLAKEFTWLAGEGLRVTLWCKNCGAVYDSPEGVLGDGQTHAGTVEDWF